MTVFNEKTDNQLKMDKMGALAYAKKNPNEALDLFTDHKNLKKFIKGLVKDHKFPKMRIGDVTVTGITKKDVGGRVPAAKKNIFIYNQNHQPRVVDNKFFKHMDGTRLPYEYFTHVTPMMSLQILLAHNARNRNVNWKRVFAYTNCMLDENWFATHQGIAFYEDGVFCDGQHRLLAVLLSGKSLLIRMTFGIYKDSCYYIDEGRQRSVIDQVQVLGEKVTTRQINTASWILEHNDRKCRQASGYYRKEIVDFFHKHQEAIDFACHVSDEIKSNKQNIFRKVLDLSTLRAVIARMYYHVSNYDQYNNGDGMSRLVELRDMLLTGSYNYKKADESSGAMKIAYIRTNKSANKKVLTGSFLHEGYMKAEKCFDAFMKKRKVNSVTVAKEELFPFTVDEEKAIQEHKRNIIRSKDSVEEK
jgi:hypothetical protein